ncbi:MAG: hypothetical protein A2275_04755 [Bacteroidetes bacterium RIFOXYA12_FULL_35_11]|nr:MAG: hypothetical protein A2X01_13960 [Bacteroidetes bacterium GWF2_35_48]OFY73986.1 MAG: hypothetical protein A2275_04755 [Bacteroidetes bacterium RIFOXYA12_FULL_35_11]HBX52107.1 hypothetical protein [Bacteroidales bacterium]
MKKIFVSIISILFVSFTCLAQLPEGWDCDHPVVINSLPFSGIDFDTQIQQNIYSATSCSANQTYMNGKDLIFTFTPLTSMYVNTSVTNTAQTGVGVFIFSDCPDQPGVCVTSNGSFLGTPSLTNTFLTGGVTYYFVVSTDPSVFSGHDYVMFDISITESIHDGGIFSIATPVSACGLTNNESVSVQIKNFSSNAISNVPVFYSVNNGAAVSETYTGQIGANGVVNYTFSTHADLSASGTYIIKSYTQLQGDNNAVNDTSIVTITNTPGDAGINLISAPVSGCGLGSNETITVTINNFGSCAIGNIPVSYSINNGASVTENYTGTIAAGTSSSFTFSTPADLSAAGTYEVKSYSSAPGDASNINDTVIVTIVNTHGVSVFPYEESFDNGITYWTTGGTNSSWEMSFPNVKEFMNSVVSDTACMITNGYGPCTTGEDSYIESPCFDFTQLVNPTIEMSIWYETGDGGASLFSSTDNGSTWQLVTENTGAVNWYNTATQWAGSTHKWLVVKRNISEFAGLADVRFRFAFSCPSGGEDGFAIDDFRIGQCAPMPSAAFNFNANGYTVSFQNSSTDATAFVWSFGDGGSSTQVSPTHTYTSGTSFQVKLVATNNCGTDTIVQTVTLNPTGINAIGNISNISIYPNPAFDSFVAEVEYLKEDFVLSLVSITGQELFSKKLNSEQTIVSLDGIAKGVYMIKIQGSETLYLKRLIVQ